VLGIDPDPSALWPLVAHGVGRGGRSRGPVRDAGLREPAVAAVLDHCRALLDATADACVAAKVQLARFEALGPAGLAAARAVAEHARQLGLLVIADGKRGDVEVSARAYADALFGGLDTPFGGLAGLEADLATVNPLMGRDAIRPFVSAARSAGAGVLVLVRTSNPGAADIEDLELREGGAVWERVAMIVDELGADGVGEAGLSDVGAVMGATEPGHLARARELMPGAVFLLPGVGAQGGRVEDLVAAFSPGRAAGLISASRAIADAHRNTGGEPASAAREEAERLREAAWELSERAIRCEAGMIGIASGAGARVSTGEERVTGSTATSASAGVVGSAGTVAGAGVIGSAGTVASAGVIGSAGTVASAGVIGSSGTVASAATVGSAGVLLSAGVVGSAGVIAGLANAGCLACVACVGCANCVGCVACVGCVGLRGVVGAVGRSR